MARFVRMMANLVCMYCGSVYGTVSGSIDSHGCCPRGDCQARMRREMR